MRGQLGQLEWLEMSSELSSGEQAILGWAVQRKAQRLLSKSGQLRITYHLTTDSPESPAQRSYKPGQLRITCPVLVQNQSIATK